MDMAIMDLSKAMAILEGRGMDIKDLWAVLPLMQEEAVAILELILLKRCNGMLVNLKCSIHHAKTHEGHEGNTGDQKGGSTGSSNEGHEGHEVNRLAARNDQDSLIGG